jgi:multidrug resistance efflux pump
MSERDARAQLAEVQERLDMHEASLTKLRAKLQARSDDLATQRAVNQQLMLKKEETEWQLLAAIAQVRGLSWQQCFRE